MGNNPREKFIQENFNCEESSMAPEKEEETLRKPYRVLKKLAHIFLNF